MIGKYGFLPPEEDNMKKAIKACVSGILSFVMVLLCTAAVVGMAAVCIGLFHIAGHGTVGVWRYDLSMNADPRELIVSEQMSSLTPLNVGDTAVFLDFSKEGEHRAMLAVEDIESGSFSVKNAQGGFVAIPEANLIGRVIWRCALPPVLDTLSGVLPGGEGYLWYWLGGGWLVVCLALFCGSISLRRVVRRRQIRKELTAEHMMPESSVDLTALVTPEEPVELEELPEEEEIPVLTIEDMYEATRRKREELAHQAEEEQE